MAELTMIGHHSRSLGMEDHPASAIAVRSERTLSMSPASTSVHSIAATIESRPGDLLMIPSRVLLSSLRRPCSM